MLDFNYSLPTNFIFGKDAHKRVGQVIRDMGYGRVLFVHEDVPFITASGLLGAVLDSLQGAGLTVVEYTGVVPNPRLSLVHKGIAVARENQSDFILALGGGSTIDTAKAIAAGVPYDGDVWDYFANAIGVHPVFSALPLGVILTIAATGSESNAGCMLTNENGNLKQGCGGPALYPKFAIMNPELTCSLPAFQTACGVADMFSHICERYFTNTPNTYIIDGMCEGLMRSLRQVGPLLMQDLTNYDYRAEVMWAGTVAHNDTVGVGREQDWATHDMAHEIQGIYNTTHGAAISIMLPAWMKHVWKHDPDRFVRYARNVMEIDTDSCTKEEAVRKGIEKTGEFFKSLGMPGRLSEIGVDDSRFEEMAEKAVTNRGTIGFFQKLDKNDIISIYNLAK